MPIYAYRCASCGQHFEIRQGFDEDDLTTCPLCSAEGHVRRVLEPAGIIFKGSGFYVTDNKRSKNPAAPGTNGRKEGNGAGTDAAAAETKSGAKAESKSQPAGESRLAAAAD
ncbi:MAG: zinc ribbon domain-containing protein [Anaerolineae bacterium]